LSDCESKLFGQPRDERQKKVAQKQAKKESKENTN
jgi:hypothetical protein